MEEKKIEQLPMYYKDIFDMSKFAKIIHEHGKKNRVKLSMCRRAYNAIKQCISGVSVADLDHQSEYSDLFGFLGIKSFRVTAASYDLVDRFILQNTNNHAKLNLIGPSKYYREYDFWNEDAFVEFVNRYITLYNQSELTKEKLRELNDLMLFVSDKRQLIHNLDHYEEKDRMN